MAVIFVWLLSGCAANSRTDTVMSNTNPFGWLNEESVEFENTDTLAKLDMALVLRCGSDIDTRNLPLTLTVTAPDSSRFVERRVFPVTLPEKTASTSATVTIPYRRSVRFSQLGIYTITMKPSHVVCGVEAAGFTFQKTY